MGMKVIFSNRVAFKKDPLVSRKGRVELMLTLLEVSADDPESELELTLTWMLGAKDVLDRRVVLLAV